MTEEIRMPSSIVDTSLHGGVNLLLDDMSQKEIGFASSNNLQTPSKVEVPIRRAHKTYVEGGKTTSTRRKKDHTMVLKKLNAVSMQETSSAALMSPDLKLGSQSRYGEFFKRKFHFTGIVYTGLLILRLQKHLRERKLIAMTNQLLDKTNKQKNFKDEEFTLLNIKRIQEELVKKREFDDPYSLELEEKITWATINKRAFLFDDKDRFYSINRRIFLFSKRASWICSEITKSKLFRLVMNLLVIAYCILDVQHIKSKGQVVQSLKYIQVIFVFELLIKIIGFGFYFSNEGFLKNGWNISDLILVLGTIVIQSVFSYELIDLIPFKMVNILRFVPIMSLQSMLQGLFSSFLLVAETFLVVFFLILIFAISGLQIFSGLLKYRCFDGLKGKPLETLILCGNKSCPENSFCAKLLLSDEINSNSFDNLYFSLVQMLRIITINDWTDLQQGVQRTFTDYSFPYFVVLLILGNYFLLNMILAVLKVKFTQAQKSYIEKLKMPRKKKNIYNLKRMKEAGLFITQKHPTEIYKTMLRQKIILDLRFPMKDANARGRKSKNRVISENRLSNLIPAGGIPRLSLLGQEESSPTMKKQGGRKVSNNVLGVGVDSILRMTELERKMFSRLMKYMSYFQSKFYFFKKTIESYYENDRNVRRAYLVVKVKKDDKFESLSESDVLIRKVEAKLTKIKRIVKNKRLEALKKKEKKKKIRINYGPYMVKKYIKMNPLSLIDIEIIRKLKSNDLLNLIRDQSSKARKKRVYPMSSRSENYKFQQLSNFSNFFLQKTAREFMSSSQQVQNTKKIEGIKVKDHSIKKRLGRGKYEAKQQEGPQNRLGIEDENLPMDYEVIRNTILLKFPKKMVEFEKYDDLYEKILKSERAKAKMSKRIWSGSTVLKNMNFSKLMFTLYDLNKVKRGYLYIGFSREFYFLRKKIKDLISTAFFKYLFFLFVILNTVILSLEGAIDEDTFATANTVYTFLFLFEFILKVLGMGLQKYFKDRVNIVDFCIIIFSLVDMIIRLLIKDIEQTIRIFRCIKVLRIIRVMRNLQYMNFITFVISNTFSKFIYIAFLLLLLIFAFAIMGMQLFNRNSEGKSYLERKSNFNSFFSAIIAVFQIITLDDWYKMFVIYYDKSNSNIIISYYFAVIFIGNFVVLNLFIANMLDGFERAHVLLTEDESIFFEEDKNITLEKELLILDIDTQMDTGGRGHHGLNYKKDQIRSLLESEEDSQCSSENEADLEQKKNTNSRSSLSLGNYDRYSLFIFPPENWLRRFSCAIVRSRIFEKFMNLVLFLAVIKLTLDTFDELGEGMKSALVSVHIALNLIFVIECLLKIIDRGLVISKNSFLREWPNCLDLVTSVVFFLDWIINRNSYSNLKVLTLFLQIFSLIPKLFRILYEKEDTKMIIRAMISAFPQIFQVLLVAFFVWLMYGIVGVTLFRQRFGYCLDINNFDIDQTKCGLQSWKRYENHFDNILNSMLTLLTVSTFDNWTEIMAVAANSDINGPRENYNRFSAYFFFTSFIIIGTYLFLNLFIGVIFSNFLRAEKQSSHEFLSEEQVKWTEFLKVMIESEPYKFYKPRKGYKKFFYSIITSFSFTYGIVLCLWLNLIVLSIFDDASDQGYKSSLDRISYFLAFVYASESLLKILSYGLYPYFTYEWHRFEFAIAVFNVSFAVVESLFEQRVKKLDQGERLLRALGLLRISALIRFVKIYEWLGNFLHNLLFSIPHIMNVVKILVIVYFTFAVVGCHMFGSYIIKEGSIIDEYVNFSNIFYALMTLFRCTTGEDWSKIMFNFNSTEMCLKPDSCSSEYAIPFFVIFMLITHFLLLNLIILIIIHQFENYHKSPLNPIDFFKFLNKFRSTWMKYVEEQESKSLHITKILNFFKYLGPPLGCNKWDNFLEVGKKILKMNIMCDKDGFTQFNELLYGTLKNNYYSRIFEETNSKSLRYLQKKEDWFYRSLDLRNKFFKNSSFTLNLFTQLTKMQSANSDQKLETKNKAANPLYFYLIVYMAFNSWRKFSLVYLKKPRDKRIIGSSMLVVLNNKKDEEYLSDSSIEEDEENEEESLETGDKCKRPDIMVQYLEDKENRILSPIVQNEENQRLLNIQEEDEKLILDIHTDNFFVNAKEEQKEFIPNLINED